MWLSSPHEKLGQDDVEYPGEMPGELRHVYDGNQQLVLTVPLVAPVINRIEIVKNISAAADLLLVDMGRQEVGAVLMNSLGTCQRKLTRKA